MGGGQGGGGGLVDAGGVDAGGVDAGATCVPATVESTELTGTSVGVGVDELALSADFDGRWLVLARVVAANGQQQLEVEGHSATAHWRAGALDQGPLVPGRREVGLDVAVRGDAVAVAWSPMRTTVVKNQSATVRAALLDTRGVVTLAATRLSADSVVVGGTGLSNDVDSFWPRLGYSTDLRQFFVGWSDRRQLAPDWRMLWTARAAVVQPGATELVLARDDLNDASLATRVSAGVDLLLDGPMPRALSFFETTRQLTPLSPTAAGAPTELAALGSGNVLGLVERGGTTAFVFDGGFRRSLSVTQGAASAVEVLSDDVRRLFVVGQGTRVLVIWQRTSTGAVELSAVEGTTLAPVRTIHPAADVHLVGARVVDDAVHLLWTVPNATFSGFVVRGETLCVP